MNKVILIGRSVADAEAKQTQTGTSVSRYTLAVDRPVKASEEKTADFISCICFGKNADFANLHLKKGTKIAIEGRIQTGSYEKDGKKVFTTDIVVDRHEFVESKQNGSSAPDVSYTAPAEKEDFPFDDDNSDLPW